MVTLKNKLLGRKKMNGLQKMVVGMALGGALVFALNGLAVVGVHQSIKKESGSILSIIKDHEESKDRLYSRYRNLLNGPLSCNYGDSPKSLDCYDDALFRAWVVRDLESHNKIIKEKQQQLEKLKSSYHENPLEIILIYGYFKK